MEFSENMTPEMGEMLKQIFMNQMKVEKEDKRKRFQYLNQFVKKGQILFAGSSLMEQFPIYEFLLDFDLPYHIYNRGIGGFTTTEMLDAMKECVYDLEAQYIFLNIGTNDLNGEEYSEQQLIENYQKIIDGIRQHLPEAKIYLMAYYPVNSEIGLQNPYMKHLFIHRTNQRIHDANCAVQKMAETNHLEFLDFNQAITDEFANLKKEYTIEGMHMYANGYEKILKMMLPVLEDIK